MKTVLHKIANRAKIILFFLFLTLPFVGFSTDYTGSWTKHYEMLIYNRWGEMIFRTTDTEIGLDGKSKNGRVPAQMEVYAYIINLTSVFDRNYLFTGHVTLVR